jgi:hypothetical protein
MSLPGICQAALIVRFRDFLAPSLGTARPNYCPVEVGIILHVLHSSFSNANISFTFCANYLQLRYHAVDIDKLFGHPQTYFGPEKEVISSGSVARWGQASASFRVISTVASVGIFSAFFTFEIESPDSAILVLQHYISLATS